MYFSLSHCYLIKYKKSTSHTHLKFRLFLSLKLHPLSISSPSLLLNFLWCASLDLQCIKTDIIQAFFILFFYFLLFHFLRPSVFLLSCSLCALITENEAKCLQLTTSHRHTNLQPYSTVSNKRHCWEVMQMRASWVIHFSAAILRDWKDDNAGEQCALFSNN